MTRHWGGNPFTGETDAGPHEGVIALSTRKTAPQQPEPAPVNTHPGPDLAPEGDAAA